MQLTLFAAFFGVLGLSLARRSRCSSLSHSAALSAADRAGQETGDRPTGQILAHSFSFNAGGKRPPRACKGSVSCRERAPSN